MEAGTCYVPVPASGTVWGLPPPSSLTVKFAKRCPVACGVNVTLIVQLPPAGTLDPQLLVWAKSPASLPLMPILLMLTGACESSLVNVIGIGELLVPTFWSPKFTPMGESFTTVPVPDRATVCGLPWASSVTASMPFADPRLVGENRTVI